MMRAEGVLLSRDGPKENIIKMKPPIVFSMENANEVLEKIEKCFDKIENCAK
jgi:4-aminobutyrate aminotransferase-like enzyme